MIHFRGLVAFRREGFCNNLAKIQLLVSNPAAGFPRSSLRESHASRGSRVGRVDVRLVCSLVPQT